MNQPTRSASIARLVPADELAAANALNATVMGMGGILGPLLAGTLIPVLGLSTLYLIDSIALLGALSAVIRLPPLPPLHGIKRRAGLSEIGAGLKYMSTHQVLLVSYVVDIVAMVFGMPRALFPEMAQQTFGDPPGGGFALGILFAAIPIGALVGGLMSGTYSRVHRHGLGVLIAVSVWGVGVIGFGLMKSLWIAAAFLALAGAADMISMVFRSSILQAAATDEMRGRMQGVFTVVVVGGPRIADLLHGLFGATIGTGPTVVAGGVLVLLGMIGAAIVFPAFRSYRV
jgi:MFS family permease